MSEGARIRVYYRPGRRLHYHRSRTCWALHPSRTGPVLHVDLRNVGQRIYIAKGLPHQTAYEPCRVCVLKTWELSTPGHGALPDIVIGKNRRGNP